MVANTLRWFTISRYCSTLEINNLCDNIVKRHFNLTLDQFASYRKNAHTLPARKLSLSCMSRQFRQVVCDGHFFLDEAIVFHAMDSIARYSVGSFVPDNTRNNAILHFDILWISHFWPLGKVLFDPAFDKPTFKTYLDTFSIEFGPLPPRHRTQNAIEAKHRILRDIYLRLKNDNPEPSIRTSHLLVIFPMISMENKFSLLISWQKDTIVPL